MDDVRQPAEMRGQLDLELTAEVVSAYVSNNPVPASELATLIANSGGVDQPPFGLDPYRA